MSLAPGFRRHSRTAFLAVALLIAVAACEPEPTPLPVVPVATTPAPETTDEASVRPALTVDALTLRLLPDEARARLEAAAEVVEANGMPLPPVGSALSVLPFEGGTPTGFRLNVAAQLDLAQPPLNNPQVASAVIQFLSTRSSETLRLDLANAGYPDGVTLTVSVDPALWPLLQPGLGGAPIGWFPVAEGLPAPVALGAGARAGSILAAGGSLLGTVPLYAEGWSVDMDADNQPVFVPASSG